VGRIALIKTPPRNGAGRTPVCAERRRLLLRAGTVCAALGALACLPARAATAARPRSLSFVNIHTGETLTAPYFDGSAYSADCLSDVNHLLRDWRTGEVHAIDPALLDVLYDLQVLADRDAAYEVICGYRSAATNVMLHRLSGDVAEHSQHLLGKAIDVRLSGYSTATLAARARTLSRGGVGFYANSDFVHVDTGRVRFW